MGARLRWASLTRRTIWASSVSVPTRSARITNEPLPLTRAAGDRLPTRFSTGMGSPVSIDSSTALAPSMHHPVGGHALARAHPQPVAGLDLGQRDVLARPVSAAPGGPSSG